MIGNKSLLAATAVSGLLAATSASAATFVPDPVLASNLLVELEYQGQAAPAERRNNIAAPVTIGDHLYILDQRNTGIQVIDTSGDSQQIISADSLPFGVTPPGNNTILGMAGVGDRAYVTYLSETLPDGFGPVEALPDDDRYGTDFPRYELIFAYDRAADGSLSNPSPVTAFDAAINGHRSGGMLVLPDGRILYARGDNLSPDYDGLTAPQDTSSTLSKLVAIDPATGETEVLAQGLRNVQRLTYTGADQTTIAFGDIGWRTAEEINVITVADLVDTTEIENFGWGRNADGLAREGTFYVGPGPESDSEAIGMAPLGEPGFTQPFAQFGRDGRDGFFAVSGPVASSVSFDTIGLLFGDLASGELFATLAGAEGTLNDVYSVGILGPDGARTTYQELFGTARDEPRFFNYADGTAGVLFERSGRMFSINEVVAPVPLGASAWYLALGLVGAGTLARSRRVGTAK